ncbi:MAG: ABC transporter [Oleiphilus sp.]|nr:MAG: ABC transporter [Oleiphilus sp.]
MKTKYAPNLLIAVFIAMFVVIMLSSKYLSGMRIDLSENGLYTLSDGTINILQDLEQEVTLDFYFSEKATSQLPALRTYAQRVQELLQEYVSHADGKLSLNKIDPEPFSEAEDQAAMSGLQGVPAGTRGDEVYFGLVAKGGEDREEVIPFFQPDKEAFLEYDLTRLISSLSQDSMPKVGIFSGIEINGGFDYMTRQPRQAWAILQFIEDSFEVEWIEPKATRIENVDVLLLIAPQNLSDELQFAIDQFVLSGGRTLVFLDPYSEAMSSMSGMPSVQRSDLADLLPGWGLKLKEEVFVKDYANSMVVGVGPQRQPTRHLGLLSLTPEDLDNEDITLFGLESLNWSSAGILETTEEATTEVTVLAQSSDQAQPHKVEDLLQLHDPQTLMQNFAPTGERYVLAARVSGQAKTAFPDGVEIQVEIPANEEDAAEQETPAEPEFETRLLTPEVTDAEDIQVMVVSDTDILSDRLWVQVQNFFGQQIVTPWSDNGSFLINSLEHMSGHPDLIEVRSQGRFNRPFTRVEALRRDAEERFLAEQEVLESELDSLETKLVELEQLRDEGDGALFTPEQEAELMKFQEEKLKIRKKLRDVQHQLDQDIEALGTQLKLINILLLPGLLMLYLLFAAARKRFS